MTLLAKSALVALASLAPPGSGEDGRAVVFVDPDLAADEAVRKALGRYVTAVRSRFDYELLVEPIPVSTAPVAIRARLREVYDDGGLRGVFLIGAYEFARFENAIGERGIFPEFFQDLNGRVEDDDDDGVFDRYEPWGGGDEPVLELWLATFRPYSSAPDGASAAEQVVALLERGERALRGPKTRSTRRASIFTTEDWSDQSSLAEALRGRYRKRLAVLGPTAEATSRDQFVSAVERAGELLFVFAHSGPTAHHLDGAAPGNLVVPTAAGVDDERLALDQVEVGAETVFLWACSILDLDEIPDRDTPFLANAYLLAEDSRCRTVLGAARSIGLENLPFLAARIGARGVAFPDSWLAYQNSVWDEGFLRDWLGVRGVWEKERGRFNWSYLIYGDPFARFAR